MGINVNIFGDGAVANALALRFSENLEFKKIKMFVPAKTDYTTYGASRAAGAMMNHLSEIESYHTTHEHKAKLEMGFEAKELWSHYNSRYNLGLIKKPTVVVNNPNDTEMADNFDAILRNENINSLSHSANEIQIPNEGYVDTSVLFERYNELLEGRVTKIECHLGPVNIGQFHDSDCVNVFALGSNAGEIIGSKYQELPKIFHGLGHGVIIKNNDLENIDYVLRTPNRLLSCGIHIVPQQTPGYFYIGADHNIVSIRRQSDEYMKMSTLDTFFTIAENVLGLSTIRESEIIRWVTGYRPVSVDSFPLVGEMECNDYIVSGTRRDGFFMSHYYAKIIEDMILGDNVLKFDYIFDPYREPIDWLSEEECLHLYNSTRKYSDPELTKEKLREINKILGVNPLPDIVKFYVTSSR